MDGPLEKSWFEPRCYTLCPILVQTVTSNSFACSAESTFSNHVKKCELKAVQVLPCKPHIEMLPRVPGFL